MFFVFKSIGYEKISFDTLKLRTPIDDERVSVMGFELYLAHYQLYILQSTQLLTSEYAMEDIIEGWLHTTGNLVNIREWLGKNKFGAESANQIASSPSADLPEETRPDSFTIGYQSSFDKNGYPVKNSVKYPAGTHFGEQDLQLANRSWQKERKPESGLSSLPAVNIPDCNLYGEDDYVRLEDNGKRISESYLRTTRSGEFIELENKYLDNMQEEQVYMNTSQQDPLVVARGGNLDVRQKEKVSGIWKRRERHYRETASSTIQPTQEPMIADATSVATMRLTFTCAVCSNNVPYAYYCGNCKVEVCDECVHTLQDYPCTETRHDWTNLSSV